MNRLTNAAKYAAVIMSLIVTVTMMSGCKKNNIDASSKLNKSDIEETSQDMTGSRIEDSEAVSLLRTQQKQKAQSRQKAILKRIQNRLKQMQGRRRRRIHI